MPSVTSRVIAAVFVLLAGCQSGPTVPEPTTPERLFVTTLPDPPEEVPVELRVTAPVSSCVVEGSESTVGPGVFLSDAMAMRAARLRVAYDELRGLYQVDLRTMDRERDVYERHLRLADEEITRLRRVAERSWFEQNAGTIGLVLGVVVGVAVSLGVLAATVEIRD